MYCNISKIKKVILTVSFSNYLNINCLPTDDGLSMNEIDLKFTSYNVIAPRLGLTDRRPIPDPMPFPTPDPLGASTLAPSLCDPPEAPQGRL